MPDSILVSELYGPVLQGEGALAGKVSHFLRTAGCSFRCNWCDSMHAVDPIRIKATAVHMTPDEIIDKLMALPFAPWVTFSGGDPVAWDLGEVCYALRTVGPMVPRFPPYKMAVETQGVLWNDWLEYVDLVTCSPKGPSSGMMDQLDIAMLRKYHARIRGKLIFKIVAFDEADLDFVERIHRGFPDVPLYITAGTPMEGIARIVVQMNTLERYREISEAVLKRPNLVDVTVGCQNHVLLYGRELGR